jgi:hypothetical protein
LGVDISGYAVFDDGCGANIRRRAIGGPRTQSTSGNPPDQSAHWAYLVVRDSSSSIQLSTVQHRYGRPTLTKAGASSEKLRKY